MLIKLPLLIFVSLAFFTISETSAQENSADPTEATRVEQNEEEPVTENSAAADNPEEGGESKNINAESSDSSQANSNAVAKGNRRIARAQFTTEIVDREPIDDVVMVPNNQEKIYFFTELINFNGQTIKHRWEYEGKEMALVNFNVEGPRWRVHSSKNIKPEWTGVWSVIVYDQENRPLKVTSFEVVDSSTEK